VVTLPLEVKIKKFSTILRQEIMSLIVHLQTNYQAEDWSKITEDAKNLIRKMLTKDYKQRISA
jgi:calcium-dependent protein kinase